jgi:VWFA-related protein
MPSCRRNWNLFPARILRELRSRSASCLVVLLMCGASASAGQDNSQVFRTEAVGVVVDVVVRDAHGRLLQCLSRSDFGVFEDAKEQQIQGFEIIGSPACENATASETERNRVPLDVATAPPVTAIIFEELGPEARAAAFRAAHAFIRERRIDTEFVGIFTLDFAIHTVVPYTRDENALLDGVRRAAMRPGCPEPVIGIVANADAGTGCAGQGIGEIKVKQTLSGLQAVVKTLALLPGRKNVLFFTEGFRVSTADSAVDRLEALIDAANQRTVTFHAIDAAGLRAIDGRQDTRQRLSSYAGTENLAGGLATKSEDANALLGLDPTTALAQLAAGTGGEFVADTNGLDAALKQLAGDMHDYYRLTYRPTDQSSSRRYRRIVVKVAVPGAVVHTRSGYYTDSSRDVPTLQPTTVAPHLILDSGATPRDFELTTSLHTNGRDLEVRASVPAAGLWFTSSANRFEAGVTILVRAIGPNKEVFAAVSDSFALRGPSEGLPTARARLVQFTKSLPLNNARTIEIIAYDVFGQRATVERHDAGTLPR